MWLPKKGIESPAGRLEGLGGPYIVPPKKRVGFSGNWPAVGGGGCSMNRI